MPECFAELSKSKERISHQIGRGISNRKQCSLCLRHIKIDHGRIEKFIGSAGRQTSVKFCGMCILAAADHLRDTNDLAYTEYYIGQ